MKSKIIRCFTVINKALRISMKSKRKIVIAVNVIGLLLSFIPTLTSLIIKSFTNSVTVLETTTNTYALDICVKYLLILALLSISQLALVELRDYFNLVNDAEVHRYLKEYIIKCTCTVKFKYLENYKGFKEKIMFIATDAGEKVANSINAVIRCIYYILSLITIIYVLGNENRLYIWILVITSIPAAVFTCIEREDDFFLRTKWSKEGGAIIDNFHDCCAKYSANEIRFRNLFSYVRNKWVKAYQEYIQSKNRMIKRHVFYNCSADLIRCIAYISVLVVCYKSILISPLKGIGSFMLVYSLATQLQDNVSTLFSEVGQLIGNVNYMEDFFSLENLEYEERKSMAKKYNNLDIRFKNVSFTYPGSDIKAIDNCNVHISPGEKVAIVGKNGSGKSTFINLLCGIYDVDEGDIIINNISLNEHISRVRKSISIIFQDFGRLSGSIRDNIVYDLERCQQSEIEKMRATISKLGFERDFPSNSFDIDIGEFSEKKQDLSVGQWQKIALCRCFYNSDTCTVILDEPTAALDAQSEATLYKTLLNGLENKSVIIVSHRLSVSKIVDRILVFDGGKIIGDGTHDELLKNNAVYAEMYHAQAKWYM